ncbi:MAG: type VI secretion system accessory protein TagJ [Pseudomonadota bacterium]
MSIEFSDYLKTGDLQGWIAALSAEVKKNPADSNRRYLLGQAHLINGAYDKADTHFDLASTNDPSWGPKIAMLRQLVRALKCREECFGEGRAPELLKDPSPYMEALLKANAALRENDPDTTALFEAAEALRPASSGKLDGDAFDDFRDLDDRIAGVVEILTSTGKYFWASVSDIRSISFSPVSRPSDIVVRQVEIDVDDGPTGVVFLPVNYPVSSIDVTDALKLGLESDWSEGDAPPILGEGRRCIFMNDEVHAFGQDMLEVEFNGGS